MRYDDDDEEEQLGYKRPPSWARFKKGQSGNPKGRPRMQKDEPSVIAASSSSDDIFRSELARPVQLTEGGQRKQMEMLQVVMRAQLKTAATGNHIAQRDVLRQAREMEERDAVRAEQAALEKTSDYRSTVAWKKRRTAEWAQAQGRGEEPDPIWPHPDDIILHPETLSWTPRGPFKLSHVPDFEYYRAERDFNFAQLVLDERLRKEKDRGKPSLYDFWATWDGWLPLRWQIAGDLVSTCGHYDALPLSKLRSIVDEADRRRKRLSALVYFPKDRSVQKEANDILRPLLKIYGFRSLAQFEAAYEAEGETMKLVRVTPSHTAKRR